MNGPTMRDLRRWALWLVAAPILGVGGCSRCDNAPTLAAEPDVGIVPRDGRDEVLRAIEGDWIGEESGRKLTAVRVGDRVEFRVVDSDQWNGAYRTHDARFSVRVAPQGGPNFVVEDFGRTIPPYKGSEFTKAAWKSCALVGSDYGGKPLPARYEPGASVFSVTLLEVEAKTEYSGNKMIECTDMKVTGVVTAKLRRPPV